MIDSTPSSPRPKRCRTLVLACLLLAATVGGCSSSTGKAAKRSAVRTPTGTSIAGGVDSASATEITTAYLHLFDPTFAEAQKLGLIQDGAAFSQAISEESKSGFAKAASVEVTKVSVNSADKATVIFTVLLGKSPALPNQTGYAVHEQGTWKVAGATFCRLVAAEGPMPAVCHTAPATTLPG